MPRTAMQSRRTRTSCSILALATVMAIGATPAAAATKSFNGTGTFVNGTGTITTSTDTTNITITSPQAVINWLPDDNATNTTANIIFQPVGTTANFTNGGSVSDFAVLNNINSASLSRAIELNGTINTRVSGSQRGSVYFYAPGGFLLSGSSVFSVGSMVVSALPIMVDAGTGQFINGVDRTVVFQQATNAGATITSNGAISAVSSGFGITPPGNAYVAMVAPRVVHTGTINVNGSAALVAAEAATINFSPDGLFDIQVTTGTTDGQGLNVNGDITGPSPGGASDKQGIYLVAVPKNDVLTMVIGSGSDLGFTLAGSAAIDDNGAVVLSAGHNITDGTVNTLATSPTSEANMLVTGLHATNNVTAVASGNLQIQAASGANSTFNSNLTALGDGQTWINASGAGATLTVAGNLDMSSIKYSTGAGSNQTAGFVALYTQAGGAMTIGGNAHLQSVGYGGDSSSAGINGGTGTGGPVWVQAEGNSNLTITGNLTASSSGQGGHAYIDGINSGNASGGQVAVSAFGGNSHLTVSGSTTLLSYGQAGQIACFSCSGTGGSGIGGPVNLYATGANSTVLMRDILVTSSAVGGTSDFGTGGSGKGGTVTINANSGGSLTATGPVTVEANGDGGDGANGGQGEGGTINLSSQSTLTLQDFAELHADGLGGRADNGTGGLGKGGSVTVQADSGGTLSLQSVSASALGEGGIGDFAGDTAGNGQGGHVNFWAFAGSSLLIGGDVDASAEGYGGGIGFHAIGGTGTGGNIIFQAFGPVSTLTANGDVDLSVDGFGSFSTGDCIACGGVGGDGFGGAQENGGGILVGATGTGAWLAIEGDLIASAEGTGGNGTDADGGFGKGGHAQVAAGDGGRVDVHGGVILSADGNGGWRDGSGYGPDLAIAGDGEGGLAEVFTFGTGAVDVNLFSNVDIHADGWGGSSDLTDGTIFAGSGLGGFAWLDAQAGTIDVSGSATVTASGHGGTAFYGTGGDGTGGNAEIDALGGDVTIGVSATVDVSGIGGDGRTGGDGAGGGLIDENNLGSDGAHIFAKNGTIIIGGSAHVTSNGVGGDAGYFYGGGHGGDGGAGTGGWATITAGNSNNGPSLIQIQGSDSGAYVSASGFGGDGDRGFDGINGTDGLPGSNGNAGGDGEAGTDGTDGGTGGAGGKGTGGTASVAANAGNGHLAIDYVSASATGSGGRGGNGGFGGFGGRGGDGGAGDGLAGGNGGQGGNGGAGGFGGLGGQGQGGFISIGTASGADEATDSNLGESHLGTVFADATGYGGDGGSAGGGGSAGFGGLAGTGSPDGIGGNNGTAGADGNGGDGGDAQGGRSGILVRGSTVTIDGSTTLTADAWGGDGGPGYFYGGLQGNGGDALAGVVGILSSSRFLHPDQHATLNTGAISGSATAHGGSGNFDGQGAVGDGSYFQVDSTTAHIGSLDFDVSGDFVSGDPQPSRIAITNSIVTVDDAFAFSTIGDLSFYIDNGSLTAGTIDLTANDFVHDPLHGSPADVGSAIADTVLISTNNNFIADANWDVTNTFNVFAPGSIQLNNVHDDNGINFFAGGSIGTENLDAGSSVDLYAYDFVSTGDIDAGSSVNITSYFSSIGFGDIDASSSVNLSAGGSISGGDVHAGFNIFGEALGGNIDLDNVTSLFGAVTLDAANDIFLSGDVLADGDIALTAGGDILMGNATTHRSIEIDAGGYIDGLDFTGGDTIDMLAGEFIDVGNISAGIVNPALGGDFNVGLEAGTNISALDIAAAASVGLAAPGTIDTGDIDAGDAILGLGTGNMNLGDLTAGGEVYLADFTMYALGGRFSTGFDGTPILAATPVATDGSITVGDVDAGKFTAAAGTDLTTGMVDSNGGIGLGAGGAISTGDLSAGDFVLANAGSISTGDIDANSVDMTSTGGDIATGDIFAFGDVSLDAFGDIDTGDIEAASIDLLAGDDITTGDLTTQFLQLLSFDGDGIHTMLFPGASITLESGGDISTGDINSIDGVYANAGGGISTGNINAADFVELFAVDNILTENIFAYDFIHAESSDGSITTENLTGGDIELDAADTIAFDDVDGYDFDFSAGGNVTGGNIVVVEKASGDSGGTVTLGNITAGPLVPFEDFSVGFKALGSISVGNVSGAGHVGFATQGNLTTGNLTAGDLVMALVGGNTNINGSITTTGENGQVYMADDSMFVTGGGSITDSDDDFDPGIVLNLDPVMTGGSIAITGPVSTNLFRAAAGTTFTANNISAFGFFDDSIFQQGVNVRAGGLATVNGNWSGEQVSVTSNDIDITGTGSINASDVTLYSTNATQTVVGDGVAGGGYQLSDAEMNRINFNGELEVGAWVGGGAANRMFFGDLTYTNDSESEIEVEFAVFEDDSEFGTGRMRVMGDMAFNGMFGDSSVSFATQLFELDAATGSISLFSGGTTLAGELQLQAERVHVAESSILDQLANNPTYTGYQEDLNEAAAVQRPEGVLRVDTLSIDSNNLHDILIQNTGTAGESGTPAGFLVRQVFINDEEEVAGPPGSINLVVNGQLVTEGGTLTGIEARDALVEGEDITPFTSNSTINGCPLTGACVIQTDEPVPTGDVVDDTIDLITGNPLGDGDFGNEPDIDDNQEGDEGASNPISPPQPLFDTRPLIPGGDVNDPVSGTGNPALLGSDQCEEDEQGQCPAQGDQQ